MMEWWNNRSQKSRCCDVNRHFFDNQKIRGLAPIGIIGLTRGCIIYIYILFFNLGHQCCSVNIEKFCRL